LLRELCLDTELAETLKWNMPTYTIKGKNVITVCAFKHHAGIWFHQGSFLTDPYSVLSNVQEGKTKAMRHWRWDNIKDIPVDQVKEYIDEAIVNELAGKRIKVERKPVSYEMHPLFAKALKENKAAKRESTQISRLAKIIPMILRGEGLNDKYQR